MDEEVGEECQVNARPIRADCCLSGYLDATYLEGLRVKTR